MEGELGFLSPARTPRVSSERGDDRGFGSPTWSSPLGALLDSPSSCVSEGRAGGDGVSGFSSPTWGSPLEKLFNSPSSCVSDDNRVGGNGSGSSSATWGSPLETLFYSPSSCDPDRRGGGNGSSSGSGFSAREQALTLETLFDSPTSCVSDSHSDGNGSGFSKPKEASPLETLVNSPSSCVSDGRGCGISSSPRVSKEQDSEVQKAEGLLREIAERYDDCFLRLRNTTAELADLRRERIHLGAENLRLSLLLEELEAAEQSKQASAVALNLTPPPPRPVLAEAASGCAPKSISMRSKSFLSPKQPLREIQPQRLRVRASPAKDASEKDDGEVETMEASRQGAMKTELCNKWERGGCPYDRRGRFAHGMGELRPVIRHPRYKTLACQLFAAASGCPYGHRCHFRHSLPSTVETC